MTVRAAITPRWATSAALALGWAVLAVVNRNWAAVTAAGPISTVWATVGEGAAYRASMAQGVGG
ncbi:hypothetical protein [Nonomuraea salmonea]|uniref:hypothetical protein n=1 Tax=Nonomuraea salmonea TaxID=46181 RepID=UPI0031E66DE6